MSVPETAVRAPVTVLDRYRICQASASLTGEADERAQMMSPGFPGGSGLGGT